MPIERAQVQGCYGNITIRHTLVKTAILHCKRPRVCNAMNPTVRALIERREHSSLWWKMAQIEYEKNYPR